MGDRLRPLWDFADLDGTERRLRDALAREPGAAAHGEVLTQLARAEGLRGDFAAADRLLDEAERAADESPALQARLALERGRVRRTSGDPETAAGLFAAAYEAALAAGQDFVAVDAAHMAALASPDLAGMEAWTERGARLAEASDEDAVAYWLGPLLNNLGWAYYERGAYEAALDAFTRALAVRERDEARPAEREIARYAVGRTLRALGRAEDAVPLLEQAVAWTVSAGEPDGWFHEELAEELDAVGRGDEAAEHARLALALLPAADPSFADDAARAGRLRTLARTDAPAA